MSLTAENAKVIADYTLSDYEHERTPTRHVIAAVPAGQESYSPSGKCMTSLDLAWHIASSELFFSMAFAVVNLVPGRNARKTSKVRRMWWSGMTRICRPQLREPEISRGNNWLRSSTSSA